MGREILFPSSWEEKFSSHLHGKRNSLPIFMGREILRNSQKFSEILFLFLFTRKRCEDGKRIGFPYS